MKRKRVSPDWLRKIGVPGSLVLGIVFASIYGVNNLDKLGPNFHRDSRVFTNAGVVREVIDGDTFRLWNGFDYRLIGVDAPERGEKNSDEATSKLTGLVGKKRVWLEYDRYDDDQHGRVLAWVWIGCEKTPKFTPADYMHLSKNQSREGLMENPEGCKKGKLVQEEMVNGGLAKIEVYRDRGELKYEKRLVGSK